MCDGDERGATRKFGWGVYCNLRRKMDATNGAVREAVIVCLQYV